MVDGRGLINHASGVELFTNCGLSGTLILLGPGKYNAKDLAAKGLISNYIIIRSARVPPDTQLVLYAEDNLTGGRLSLSYGDAACLSDPQYGFDKRVVSLEIVRLRKCLVPVSVLETCLLQQQHCWQQMAELIV
jgi:hypothetical protein